MGLRTPPLYILRDPCIIFGPGDTHRLAVSLAPLGLAMTVPSFLFFPPTTEHNRTEHNRTRTTRSPGHLARWRPSPFGHLPPPPLFFLPGWMSGTSGPGGDTLAPDQRSEGVTRREESASDSSLQGSPPSMVIPVVSCVSQMHIYDAPPPPPQGLRPLCLGCYKNQA